MRKVTILLFTRLILILFFTSSFAQGDHPVAFDLRDYNGNNYVSRVKSQMGGTCWTHGVMSSIESNLLLSGVWEAAGETGEPNMAEYHLDWWNGFNYYYNKDIYPAKEGLEIHQGGDYLVASAYLARGDGVVRDEDGQYFKSTPPLWDESYHVYYVRDIDWYTVGSSLERIGLIKSKIMEHGVMGTCMYSNSYFINEDYIHYQPYKDYYDPNHAIAIVGWNDTLLTPALQPGAWLCKNSWGDDWGNEGFFWISYYDKHCGQHTEMGAISFYNIEPMQYDNIYYHDYHGWRDTKLDCQEAFNAFSARQDEYLTSVSFYTASDDVDYTIRVFSYFEEGELLLPLSTQEGVIPFTGFHTVDLDTVVQFTKDNGFYIYLNLAQGGHPIDCTSIVPILLGAETSNTVVRSAANACESYFIEGSQWVDLTTEISTANFCIKGLTKLEVDSLLPIVAAQAPSGFTLYQNFPNPFNQNTVIHYTLNQSADVRLTIYDILGREVVKLVDGNQTKGRKLISWDGLNAKGNKAASSVYIYMLNIGRKKLSRRMVLLR